MEVRERELPPLGANDVLVKVKAVGVCFGDVALFRNGSLSEFPTWGGHEAAGVVEDVGPEVTSVRPGDNVAMLGQDRFSTWTMARERDLARFTTPVSDWAQWVAEPLACCVNGVDIAGVQPDDAVAVVGCGFMGLGIIQTLRLWPVRMTVAIAPREESLKRATALGADATFISSDANLVESASRIVRPRPMPNQYLGPNFPSGPYDVVFETSGTKAGLDTATALIRIGGTLVLFGHQQGQVSIDGTDWHMKGLRVLNASPMSAVDFHQQFYRTVGLLESGRLSLDSLVTHKGSFLDAEAILEASKEPDYVKGALLF